MKLKRVTILHPPNPFYPPPAFCTSVYLNPNYSNPAMKKETLSTLWIFLTVNYIFCDVFTLMHSEDLKQLLSGAVGDMKITQGFLLGFAIIMEIPMLMIVLSRVLPYKVNRMFNIGAGILMTVVQSWSLTVGDSTLHYVFFSIIEIATSALIVWMAWKWKNTTTA